jgi:hypothetical protein
LQPVSKFDGPTLFISRCSFSTWTHSPVAMPEYEKRHSVVASKVEADKAVTVPSISMSDIVPWVLHLLKQTRPS